MGVCVPACRGTMKNPNFRCGIFDPRHILGVKAGVAKRIPINIQDRKRTITLDSFLVHSKSNFDWTIAINKQKYVNIPNIPPPRTPFVIFLFYLYLNILITAFYLSNCANLYLHINSTNNSLEQQGYEKTFQQ